MTTVVRLLGWRAEGLRCPDHDIECIDQHGQLYPVSLIQMPNGTGKTTTLTLLRAALSGVFPEPTFDQARVRSFQKRGSDKNYGVFEVRLLLNGKRVTIIINFDFERGLVAYKTTRGGGQVDGFEPPAEFRRFLSGEFVKFFVFDGELAEHLLDRQKVDAEAVVEALFQLGSLKSLARKVADYWDSKTRDASATDERALTRRDRRLSRLRGRLRDLLAERRRLEDRRASITAKLEEQQRAYYHEIKKENGRSRRLSDAQDAIDRVNAKVREQALEVLDCMRDPHAVSATFARAIYDLKVGLDRVKLPESAAREFFEELAAEPECVCGRPIDSQVSAVIRERAHRYLGSDDVSLLNSMKTAIHEAVGNSRDLAETILAADIARLGELVAERRQADNDLESLRLEAEQADPAVKRAREIVAELEDDLSVVETELQMFDSKDDTKADEQTSGIDIIRRRLKDAEEKLAEIKGTIELKDKRDALIAIIDSAYRKARELITSELCMEANQRIRDIMPFNSIAIDRIDRCLVLSDQEGASAGETLSVAYAFLATLFHRSEHQLPFVVDSPANPIDLAARPKIGELVPKLTDQFIAFTISSEREGFVPRLKQAAGDRVQFVTLFRKSVLSPGNGPGLECEHVESADGLMVQSEDFFNQFQIEAEE